MIFTIATIIATVAVVVGFWRAMIAAQTPLPEKDIVHPRKALEVAQATILDLQDLFREHNIDLKDPDGYDSDIEAYTDEALSMIQMALRTVPLDESWIPLDDEEQQQEDFWGSWWGSK